MLNRPHKIFKSLPRSNKYSKLVKLRITITDNTNRTQTQSI